MSNYGDDWRDTDFGEGQERYYGDLGGAPSGPAGGRPPSEGAPPPPVERGGGGHGDGGGGGRGKAALIAGGAAVLVGLTAGGIYLATSGDDPSPGQAQDTSPAPSRETEAATPEPSAAADPSASATPTSTHKPTVAGWRVAWGNDEYPVIFDVPPASETFKAADQDAPEWQVSTKSSEEVGFFDPRTSLRPLATTKYPVSYRLGHCATAKGNSLAFFGFFKSTSDAPEAASAASDKFLKAMSLKENGTDRVKYTEGKPKTVKLEGGKTSAVQIRTDVPWSRSDPSFCVKGERELVVTSVPTPQGTGTVIASRVKTGPGALDQQTFDRMLSTIRPRT